MSKVFLLAAVWRREFALANRVPLIPVFTCLACLFFAAFLSEAALTQSALFVPSRVLTGLGAVCFTLFSIVSILEAGTSRKPQTCCAQSCLTACPALAPPGCSRHACRDKARKHRR